MITRHGKIARLPQVVREELNLRLYNGQMGPQLLGWLNELPEVHAVLMQFFGGQAISKQNLSEWRHGGYEDWLRQQERDLRIDRVAEEGATLKRGEDDAALLDGLSRTSTRPEVTTST